MCNIYLIDRKKGASAGMARRVSDAAVKLASLLVRKSDPGLVVLAGERMEIMRWGFPLRMLAKNSTLLRAGFLVKGLDATRVSHREKLRE